MKEIHEIKADDTFDWTHAENLLNFGDCVRRKSTGLVLNPNENWHVTDDDKAATDWQFIPPVSKEYK